MELPRRIAGYGLPGTNHERAPLHIAPESWSTILAVVRDQRITGLATAAWEAGWLQLTDSQGEELMERHRDAMLGVLALERRLLILADAFEQASVDFTVLKGSAFAHSFYPDPSWRSFADIDLLVRTEDWRRSGQVLEELGIRRKLPEPRAGFDERFGKGTEHVGDGGMEVDLHRTLMVGPFGLWIDLAELAQHTAPFVIGGRQLPRLDDTAALVHASMHASLGGRPPRLLPLRDVAQIARSGRVDWETLAHWARRWKIAVVLQHALATAEEYLGAPIPEEAGEILALRPSRVARRALLAYTSDRRRRGGMTLATLHAIPGLKGKTVYVRTLLLPNRAFLAARARGGTPSYRRRWKVAVKWFARGPGRDRRKK